MIQAHPVVAAALQQALVDLTDLSLQGKQAHWNIEGPGFRSLHLHLDEIIDEVRLAADDVAERMAAIEVAPDGRAATVAATSLVDPMEPGFLPTDKTARQYEERLLGVAERIKATLDPVDEHDHLSNDLLTGIATGLEKQAWMRRAATKDLNCLFELHYTWGASSEAPPLLSFSLRCPSRRISPLKSTREGLHSRPSFSANSRAPH